MIDDEVGGVSPVPRPDPRVPVPHSSHYICPSLSEAHVSGPRPGGRRHRDTTQETPSRCSHTRDDLYEGVRRDYQVWDRPTGGPVPEGSTEFRQRDTSQVRPECWY